MKKYISLLVVCNVFLLINAQENKHSCKLLDSLVYKITDYVLLEFDSVNFCFDLTSVDICDNYPTSFDVILDRNYCYFIEVKVDYLKEIKGIYFGDYDYICSVLFLDYMFDLVITDTGVTQIILESKTIEPLPFVNNCDSVSE